MSMLLTEEDLKMEDVYCVNVDDNQVFTQIWLQECIGTAGQQLSTVKEVLRLPLSKSAPLADLSQALTGLLVAAQWDCKGPRGFSRIGLPFQVWALLGGCPF